MLGYKLQQAMKVIPAIGTPSFHPGFDSNVVQDSPSIVINDGNRGVEEIEELGEGKLVEIVGHKAPTNQRGFATMINSIYRSTLGY